jgi:hypothetical protein
VEKLLESYMTNPSEAFVNCVLTDIFPGRRTQQVISSYTGVIRDAFSQLIRNRVNNILKQAINQNVSIETSETEKAAPLASESEDNDGVVTTQEEIEAFAIIKSIVRDSVDINRIFLRDSKGSCSIVLDDNQRKPLIKLFFNDSAKKRIVLFNDKANKKENQFSIADAFEIYNHSESIKKTLENYLTAAPKKAKDDKVDEGLETSGSSELSEPNPDGEPESTNI